MTTKPLPDDDDPIPNAGPLKGAVLIIQLGGGLIVFVDAHGRFHLLTSPTGKGVLLPAIAALETQRTGNRGVTTIDDPAFTKALSNLRDVIDTFPAVRAAASR